MFVIPDKILETMTCDNCHKFLSVGPVTVFPNRRTKCGRCSQADDDGAVSQYGLLAEQGVFKCVNRFDGCRQLLRYAQVADHETICHSKAHICPVCSETTNIPTFLLIKHFEECHRDCLLLGIPSFKVQLTTPGTKTYLYRVRDNLFFIKLKLISADTIGLDAQFLGDQNLSEDVTQKFVVYYYGDDSGEYETKTCVVDSGGFLIEIPEIQTNYVFVAFHIDMGSLETRSAFEEKEKMTSALPKRLLAAKVKAIKRQRLLEIRAAVEVEAEKAIGLPRTISLPVEYDSSISLGSSSTSLLVQNSEQDRSEFVLYCMECSDINFEWWFVQVEPNLYHLICQECYEKLQDQLSRKIPEYILPLKVWRDKFPFSCIWRRWGCLQNIRIPFDGHEENCLYQPLHQCPVPNCFYERKLFDLRSHFLKWHPLDRIILNPRGEISYGKVSLRVQYFYFWAYYGFVPISVYRNIDHLHITIFKHDTKGTTSRLKTTVAIFENGRFLKTITANDHYNLRKNLSCDVQCFLKC